MNQIYNAKIPSRATHISGSHCALSGFHSVDANSLDLNYIMSKKKQSGLSFQFSDDESDEVDCFVSFDAHLSAGRRQNLNVQNKKIEALATGRQKEEKCSILSVCVTDYFAIFSPRSQADKKKETPAPTLSSYYNSNADYSKENMDAMKKEFTVRLVNSQAMGTPIANHVVDREESDSKRRRIRMK